MQSISVFKSNTISLFGLEPMQTSRTEIVNGIKEDLEFQLNFNNNVGDYIECHIKIEEPYSIKGRIGTQKITEVIISKKYKAYLNDETGVFIVLANKENAKKISQEFYKACLEKANKLNLDLQQIVNQSTDVKKAQFRKVKIETIHGSSLSGSNVTDTEIYRFMLEAGELCSITVQYPFNGEEISFSISDSGSIVIFSGINNEKILEFINQVLLDLKEI